MKPFLLNLFLLPNILIFSTIGLNQNLNQNGSADVFQHAKENANKGADQWDEQLLISAQNQFEQILQQNEEMQWLAQYYIGYIDFRLLTLYRIQNKEDKQIKHLNEGIEHLETSINQNKNFSESHALLALLLGQKFRMDPSDLTSPGLDSQSALSNARRLGQQNPRVALISGIINFYTPPEFGGSRNQALEEIKRSIQLFKSWELHDSKYPEWGYIDALTWEARLYMELNEFEKARESMEEAIRTNPQNRFAQMMKLRLEQRLKN